LTVVSAATIEVKLNRTMLGSDRGKALQQQERARREEQPATDDDTNCPVAYSSHQGELPWEQREGVNSPWDQQGELPRAATHFPIFRRRHCA
jgi:hypothetical protein